MSDSGGLSTGERINRLEQRAEAIERDCEIGTERIWKELDTMKREQVTTNAVVQAQVAEINKAHAVSVAKLSIYAAIGCALLTVLLNWGIKKIEGPDAAPTAIVKQP